MYPDPECPRTPRGETLDKKMVRRDRFQFKNVTVDVRAPALGENYIPLPYEPFGEFEADVGVHSMGEDGSAIFIFPINPSLPFRPFIYINEIEAYEEPAVDLVILRWGPSSSYHYQFRFPSAAAKAAFIHKMRTS